MAGGKLKFEEDTISEIVVADSDWEFWGGGGGGEQQQQKQQLQASAKSNHKLQQVADYQPGDRLNEGTQIFILLSVQQKVDHEIVFPPSGYKSSQQLDTVIFMWG